MVKVKGAKSKRKSSKQRHKIERKKREHKRDLKKAAKALKAKGLGPKRSKKARDMAKMALKVSNTHPDKEEILSRVLAARENAKVMKAEKRHREAEGVADAPQQTPVASTTRQLLFIPAKAGGDFKLQFSRALEELVLPAESIGKDIQEVPSAAYVITLDSRFAVQCVPWTLLDAIMEQAKLYGGKRKVLLLFVLTKAELVSAAALVSQFSLLSVELCKRYPLKSIPKHIVMTFVPFSIYHDTLSKHLLRVLNQFKESEGCKSEKMKSNVSNKLCAFVIGLPNSGRRSLSRILTQEQYQTSVGATPLRSAQLHLMCTKENTVETKFAIPNAKGVTLILFPEDHRLQATLRTITGGDVFFRSLAFVEKCEEPESIACAVFTGVVEKLRMAQAFSQPLFSPVDPSDENGALQAASRVLRCLGKTVRQENGFHVSPYFVANVGTIGQLNASGLTAHVGFTSGQQHNQTALLDSSYSNATPSKLVLISSVTTPVGKKGRRVKKVSKKADAKNILRLGARTFLRELCQGSHVPWAVMHAPGGEALSPDEVGKASEVFNASLLSGKKIGTLEELKGKEHLQLLVESLSSIMKSLLPFLPNGVVEMGPDCIAPPQYNLDSDSDEEDEEQEDAQESEDEADLESNEKEEEGEEEEEDEEEDDEEDEEN